MAEGAFPSRPPSDPLAAADRADDPLGRQERVREAERRAFLGALAAADGARATLSYARSDGGARATYPSRWLLERASMLEGRPVYASDLTVLLATGRPGSCGSPRCKTGASRVAAGSLAAVDLADRRLASVRVLARRSTAISWPSTRWPCGPTCRSEPSLRACARPTLPSVHAV